MRYTITDRVITVALGIFTYGILMMFSVIVIKATAAIIKAKPGIIVMGG